MRYSISRITLLNINKTQNKTIIWKILWFLILRLYKNKYIYFSTLLKWKESNFYLLLCNSSNTTLFTKSHRSVTMASLINLVLKKTIIYWKPKGAEMTSFNDLHRVKRSRVGNIGVNTCMMYVKVCSNLCNKVLHFCLLSCHQVTL